MQDMLVTLAATSTNALMDTSKNRRQFEKIILVNITRTYHLVFLGQFDVLYTKCSNKFDCLINEMLFITKLKTSLDVQTESIRAKVFT